VGKKATEEGKQAEEEFEGGFKFRGKGIE